MNRPRITYRPRSDTTTDTEFSVLANVYKLCLDSRARKEAATSPVSRPDDATVRNLEEVSDVGR